MTLSPALWERVVGLLTLAVLAWGGVVLLIVYVDEFYQWVRE